MKQFACLIALAVAGTASAAHAQGALYINPVAVRVSNSTADHGLYAFLGPGETSRMFYGVELGGYYNVPTTQFKSAAIGVDVRDAVLHGNNALLNSFLVGPRIAFSTRVEKLHPYVEPFVGAGSTRAPNTEIKVTKLQYGAFAGADYDFSRRVSWRIAEVGYSSLTTASGATIGASESYPSSNLLSITAGLTFLLP
jgi:hypothetical protein